MSKSTQINKRLIAKIPTPGNEVTTLGVNTVQTNNIQDGAVTNSKTNFTPPSIQRFLSGSGTYNLPSGVKYIRVKMVGGGGGGSGSGSTAGTAAGNGGSTAFGTSLLTAGGGAAGIYRGTSTGGTATVNAPAVAEIFMSGSDGNVWSDSPTSGTMPLGGPSGGSSVFGAAGRGGIYNAVGGNASSNSGSGGGGGGNNNTAGNSTGTGGGAGAYIEALILNPSVSYSYSVGGAGTAGGGGTGGLNGGTGGSGVIIIEEYYQ